MSKERNVLAQILKSWAQEHDTNLQIASPEYGDEGVDKTSGFLSWVIKETDANLDLVNLLDRLEFYFINLKRRSYPDGMFCRKCRSFYKYAEPNQPDGTLLCYSCRTNPYV
jgi:hypothetical protein